MLRYMPSAHDMPHVLLWDIETVPDPRGFAAANGLGGNNAILKLKCSASRCLNPSRNRFTLKRSLTMNTYVAIIGGKAVLTFRAVDDDQAHAMIDDQEGSVRSDLKVLGRDAPMGREIRHSGARGDGGATCPMETVSRPSNK